MKQFVDIEGAGENLTKITFPGSDPSLAGTVSGANNAELRFLSVENTGGTDSATAISVPNWKLFSGGSLSVRHVTATASGASSSNYGIYSSYSSVLLNDVRATASGGVHNYGVAAYDSSSVTMTNVTVFGVFGSFLNHGVFIQDSDVSMTHVTATAQGGNQSNGIMDTNSSVDMNDVSAGGSGGSEVSVGISNNNPLSNIRMNNVTAGAVGTASYGVYNWNATLNISNSTIKGGEIGIFNEHGSIVTVQSSQVAGGLHSAYNTDSQSLLEMGGSYLYGGPVSVSGTSVCAGNYDENYTFFASTCP
jgi:hypothetical protein